MRKIIAILCSDIHLSLKPPIARENEPNWFDAMARQLQQLTNLGLEHKAPIVCAGDIFHRWNSPPELINFALKFLPPMYAIPGQHDLPLHNYKDILKSAFWTLVQAQKVSPILPGTCLCTNNGLWLYGFPWGWPVEARVAHPNETGTHLAVVHSYIWADSNRYPGAPAESEVSGYTNKLKGYTAAVFGDNHKGFLLTNKNKYIMNCGTFMRRNSDEFEYRPKVGLLYSDGVIVIHYLNTKQERMRQGTPDVLAIEEIHELKDFIADVSELATNPLDYFQAIKEFGTSRKIDKATMQMIHTSLESFLSKKEGDHR